MPSHSARKRKTHVKQKRPKTKKDTQQDCGLSDADAALLAPATRDLPTVSAPTFHQKDAVLSAKSLETSALSPVTLAVTPSVFTPPVRPGGTGLGASRWAKPALPPVAKNTPAVKPAVFGPTARPGGTGLSASRWATPALPIPAGMAATFDNALDGSLQFTKAVESGQKLQNTKDTKMEGTE